MLRTHQAQEIPSPGHQTLPKTHVFANLILSCGSPGDLPRRQQLPLWPRRTEHPSPWQRRVCEALARPGTGRHVRIPVPQRPPRASRASGGRVALQPRMSQARIVPVPCYLGISSALYLLKQLLGSCLTRLRGLMDRETQKGPSPHLVPPEHTHQRAAAKPVAWPGLGESLYHYTPFAAPPRRRMA